MNDMNQRYAVDPNRALPTDAYRDPSFDVDIERIFQRDWVFVGTADEFVNAGDYVTSELGRQPVIVQRRQDGTLGALSNLCAHRGTLLVEGHGNTKRHQCPYHAWTYADDGRLLAVPYTAPDDIDRSAHCLPRYRAEEWHGLVFATLSSDIAPLRERFAHLEHLAVGAGLSDLHHWTSQRGEEVWRANWKLVLSNAMESYHLFKVHPETLEPYTPTAGAYYMVGSADGTATGGTSAGDDGDYVLLSLPPNFVGVITGESLLWQAVQPLGFDRTRIVTGGAFRSPSPDSQTGLAKLATKVTAAATALVPDFLPEDKAICERGQRAAIGDYSPGMLVPIEQVVVDFHHYLNRQLHNVEAPPARTAADLGLRRNDGQDMA